MDSFIKKIFEQTASGDSNVHNQFVKFSRGQFPNRAMIRAKISKGRYIIDTTAEFSKDLIITLAEKLGDQKTLVTGALISTVDLEGQFEYKERKMAMGVKKYMIESEMSGNEIIALCGKIEKTFFAFSFKSGDTELTIQIKSPKSAKGSSSSKKEGKKAKINFCKLKTEDKSIVNTLIFDSEASNFKKIEIKHDIIVDKIILPEGEDDFVKIRELAKRQGKIVRKLDIDGKEVQKEAEFIS
ncbi:hypothetical protein GOV14_00580 [Candidatus Pacearchaeota archaeon]|nr:hypothetical protein [Candidatus Pacearchaeota archaeon]